MTAVPEPEDTPYCAEGCGNPATTERPAQTWIWTQHDVKVVELVCETHKRWGRI